MCNSVQAPRKRREESRDSLTSLLAVAETHRHGATADRTTHAYYYEDGDMRRDDIATSSEGNKGLGGAGSYWQGASHNYDGEASNEFCSGSLSELLGYEPMKRVSPDESPSPNFAEGNETESSQHHQRLHLSAFRDDTGESPPIKKKLRQNKLQQRPIVDASTTAKGHQRQFAKHNYHDHAKDEIHLSPLESNPNSAPSFLTPMRGGVMAPFPIRLHNMLDAAEAEGMTDIVCWQPHGRAFVVHDPKRFVRLIMGRFFRQHKYSSFQRQLNLYGFMRLTKKGPDHGGYYHELFLRDRLHLSSSMQRVRVKGTLVRTSSSPQTEPDFYTMPFVEPLRGDVMMHLDGVTSNSGNFATRQKYDEAGGDEMPPIEPLQRQYLIQHHHAFSHLRAVPCENSMNAVPEERRGSALSRRLGMNRTPSDEADLAHFLEEVDLYSSDVETTAAV